MDFYHFCELLKSTEVREICFYENCKSNFPAAVKESQIKNWCCRKAFAAKRIIKLQQSLLKWKIRTSHSRVKLTHMYSPFDAHTRQGNAMHHL